MLVIRLAGGTDGRVTPVGTLWRLAGSSCSAVTFPERSGRTVCCVGQAQPAQGHGPAGPEVTARRFGAASPALAWVLGGAVLVLAAAAVALSAFAGQLSIDITAGVVIVLTFAGVGLVIARRQPGNPIGWIMVAFTLVYVLGGAANYYAVLYYHLGHRGLPLAALALLLSAVQAPSFAMFPVVILPFPDGTVPGAGGGGRCGPTPGWWPSCWPSSSPRRPRRWPVTTSASVPAAISPAAVTWPDDQSAGLAHRPRRRRDRDPRPVVRRAPVAPWRRADGARRQQLKWLACGGAVAAASLILAAVLGVAGLLAGLAALPVGIGVGILRYRLYDIDRIISRTLAYTLVTGVLAGVYAGLVLLATKVLSVHAPVAVAAATLAAAALFNPLRRRRVVDRRFNRARYDADQTVAAFAARLKDAVDLELGPG